MFWFYVRKVVESWDLYWCKLWCNEIVENVGFLRNDPNLLLKFTKKSYGSNFFVNYNPIDDRL